MARVGTGLLSVATIGGGLGVGFAARRGGAPLALGVVLGSGILACRRDTPRALGIIVGFVLLLVVVGVVVLVEVGDDSESGSKVSVYARRAYVLKEENLEGLLTVGTTITVSLEIDIETSSLYT